MKAVKITLLFLLSGIAFPAFAQQSRIDWVAAGHHGAMSSISYAPDGSFFVTTAYRDHHVVFWDGITGKFLSWFDFDSTLSIVKVSPDSRTIVLANDSTLFLVDVATKKILSSIRDSTTLQIQAVSFSPTGDTLAWVSFVTETGLYGPGPGRVTRYSLTNRLIGTRLLSQVYSRSIRGTSGDGEFLFSAALDRLAYYTQDRTGQYGICMYSLPGDSILFDDAPFAAPPFCFVNHDSQCVCSIGIDSIGIIDAQTGQILMGKASSLQYGFDEVHQIAKDTLFLISYESAYLLSLSTLDTIRALGLVSNALRPDMWEWSPDDRYFTTGTDARYITLESGTLPLGVARYDLNKAFLAQIITPIENSTCPILIYSAGFEHSTNSVRISPKSSKIAIGSWGGFAILDSNGVVLKFEYDECGSVAYSRDGKYLARTSYNDGTNNDGSTRVESTDSSEPASSSMGNYAQLMYNSPFSQLNFSPSNDTLAVGERLMAVPLSGYSLWPAKTQYSTFTNDGRYLYVSNADFVDIIDPSNGVAVDSFKAGNGEVRGIHFNHDGTQFVTCGPEGYVRLWKSLDHTLIHTFGGGRSSATGVQFSPNDLYLISSSLDSTIRIWEIASGVVVDSFNEFKAPYTDVQVSSDGKYVLGSTPLAVIKYRSPKVSLEAVKSVLPSALGLGDIFPNPVRAYATLRFSIPKREFVTLRFVDILGTTIATPVNDFLDAGEHFIRLDRNALELTNGVYFYELSTSSGTIAKLARVE